MIGIPRIYMYDKDGKCVYKDEKHNIITKLYPELLKDVVKSVQYPYTNGVGTIYNISPLDLSNGILLLESAQTESIDTLTPAGKITGYAGGEYGGDDIKRGTLNGEESGVIPGVGYRWTWEFITSQANGLISAVGLCPQECGNGQFNFESIGGTSQNICTGELPIPLNFGYAPNFDQMDGEGNYYYYWIYGYKKGSKSDVSYEQSFANAINVTEYDLSGTYLTCGRPVLYKNKIYLVAETASDYYLLKLTKDTVTIEQQWTLGSTAADRPDFDKAFGMTDTHMHWVSVDGKIRSFNLATSSYETTEPAISVSTTSYRYASWISTPTFAAVIGGSSTNSTPLLVYGDIIYNDLTLLNISDKVGRSTMTFNDKPYGYGYYGIYNLTNLNFFLPLFSVKNLTTPLTKSGTHTLKVVYDLLY